MLKNEAEKAEGEDEGDNNNEDNKSKEELPVDLLEPDLIAVGPNHDPNNLPEAEGEDDDESEGEGEGDSTKIIQQPPVEEEKKLELSGLLYILSNLTSP